jgi:hypothetical protein
VSERRVQRGREVGHRRRDGRREDAGAGDMREGERAGAVAEEDGHPSIVRPARDRDLQADGDTPTRP